MSGQPIYGWQPRLSIPLFIPVPARPYFSEETKRRGGGSEHREHGRHGEQANDYIFLPFEAGVNAAAEPTREATIAAFIVIDYLM